MKARYSLAFAALLALAGCAGVQRSCCSDIAENFGADWLVVQVDMNGKPFHCWQLVGTSIANEQSSDGIYWLDKSGNLVHISGLYNRVQVVDGKWDAAFASLGLTADECKRIANGKRDTSPPASAAPIIVVPEVRP